LVIINGSTSKGANDVDTKFHENLALCTGVTYNKELVSTSYICNTTTTTTTTTTTDTDATGQKLPPSNVPKGSKQL
jgi:hypothetical protein